MKARVFALVAWLEQAGFLTADRVNGVQLVYGCERDLLEAGALARVLGGKTDGLS